MPCPGRTRVLANLYKMREIISIILMPFFDLERCEYLRALISEHHEFYLRHYGRLRPKFHFLTHYPDIIKKLSPLFNVCTPRFESKHRELKLYFNLVANHINTCKTLCIKQLLQFACRLLLQQDFDNQISYGTR